VFRRIIVYVAVDVMRNPRQFLPNVLLLMIGESVLDRLSKGSQQTRGCIQ
jgi:hypothetical protein